MREIKIRAWHKTQERILGVAAINFEHRFIFDSEGLQWSFDDIELMQFTGLYDKNGKEIWEGDVVKFKSYGKISFVFWRTHKGAWALVGKEEHGNDNPVDVDYFCDADGFAGDEPWRDTVEVIGNVWENPELLKGN